MTTDIAALIAEARGHVAGWEIRFGPARKGQWAGLVHRLADALESLTASLSVSERSDATVTEVTAPATDDEREARKAAYDEAWGYRHETRSAGEKHHYEFWFNRGWDAAAGFRRSSRVPVSREELRAWAGMQVTGAPVETTANGFLGADLFDAMHERYDIFPKADRKPADSSNGDNQ